MAYRLDYYKIKDDINIQKVAIVIPGYGVVFFLTYS